MNYVTQWWDAARRIGSRFGPYVLLEVVMPGGTLLALLLYLYRAKPSA